MKNRHHWFKRVVVGLLVLTLFAGGISVRARVIAQRNTWDLTLPSLHEAFESYFLFGNIFAGGGHVIPGYGGGNPVMNEAAMEMYVHHFNAVTAENWHKPQPIAPGNWRPDEFNFTNADRIVDFAVDNDIALIGHVLVWHSQSPNWLYRTGGGALGQPLTRAEARDNMEFYIRTLAEHWTERGMIGAFYSWDVANEVIASSVGTFSGDWRNHIRTEDNPWLDAYANNPTRIPGHPTDYIYDAFVFARRYFPYSILYYNDYNEQQPGKREAIAQMVEYFNGRWAHDFENNPEAVARGLRYRGRLLIEGIGMQAHYHAIGGWTGWGPPNNPSASNVRLSIERFVQTGARVSITELDITVGGFGWQEIANPTAANWQTQADFYARVFGYILEFSDHIPRVSIWGLADHHSWRRIGHPLLFDTDYQAKPAFFAIHQALADFERANRNRVVNAPTITTDETLPSGATSTHYITQLTAERNNWAPILWTVEEGNLPPGLILHSRTGIIEGHPTSDGTFDFTIGIRNAGGLTTQEFSITIGAEESN